MDGATLFNNEKSRNSVVYHSWFVNEIYFTEINAHQLKIDLPFQPV